MADGSQRSFVNVDLQKEEILERVVNEYKPEEDDLYSFPIANMCTVSQLEIFHKTLIKDLYRRERKIKFNPADNIPKRYYIVPLRLIEPLDPNHVNQAG